MINHLTLIGILKEVDSEDKTIRYIDVARNYKNERGETIFDHFAIQHWSRTDKSALFRYKEGSFIALDGRIETKNQLMYIVVESFTFLTENGETFNYRCS